MLLSEKKSEFSEIKNVAGVPDYEWLPVTELKSTRTKYLLVIPILNEGERVRSLINKMAAINTASLIDISVVDGGSTDNALDEDILKTAKVKFLINKLGAGKLGAQLRCAYHFALAQGYDGVVTIDGNDKDDPKDIIKFITKLDEGYDFVQGSRFVKGGSHKNTPLFRWLAIRLIHAPILSLASGFKWTDTTQGFRGYSRKLLNSEKLNIFRDVFSGYELLFYISKRAPQLGFSCIEVGNSRFYPIGKVPTQINSIFSLLKVLLALIDVAFSKFD